MGSMSIVHWVAVLLVVVLIFGTKKLGNIGADLGKAVKGFKDGVKGEGEGAPQPQQQAVAPAHLADKSQAVADVEIKEVNRL